MTEQKISVLMGAYNCASTLAQAVASIQAQTYQNWELILCDDGSTDATFCVAETLAASEARIILLRNKQNAGLNVTLNRCLSAATGSLIARMDADDDCLPERFEKQAAFLREHPEYAFVSTPMILFDERGVWGQTRTAERPQPRDVVCGSPFCHAPVMLQKTCLDAVGGYSQDPKTLRVEDVDLWIRLYAKGFRGYNLQEPLYRMRNDQNALNRRKYKYRIHSTYVRIRGCRLLHLNAACYLKSFQPMINGMVPARLRHAIRHRQQRIN